jgi:hypothetical protein
VVAPRGVRSRARRRRRAGLALRVLALSSAAWVASAGAADPAPDAAPGAPPTESPRAEPERSGSARAGLGPTAPTRTERREPCARYAPLRDVYFGDLHVHTARSLDASTQGTRATPRDAYRFARGAPLGIQPYDAEGSPMRTLRLGRPLDFAAVTDHAEMLGETRICQTPGLEGYDSWVCRMYRSMPRVAFFIMNAKFSLANDSRFAFCGPDGVRCLDAARTPWLEARAAAEEAYDRTSACRFTSFVGYEWTASVDTNNLHRNVIFRNERVPELPASFFEAGTAEELRRLLRRDCTDLSNGCDALVIPHNSNLSNGLIFRTVRPDGAPIEAADARERMVFERLVEVMQHKGDSECRLDALTSDEPCAFEKLSFANFTQKYLSILAEPPDPRAFARRALEEGLAQEERIGVNPFAFGLLASTDTHIGAAGFVDERHHPGHGGAGAPAATEMPRGLNDDLEFNPGGLAAIWAEENARDALFEAMRRREVYGTSGPRMVTRLFGGWTYPADLCEDPSFVQVGYRDGVPMGGRLPAREGAGGAPTLAVSALMDPGTAESPGTPLQRIQIVKGWVVDGEIHEHVYDVAGDPDNGASVDLATCERKGEGAASLCAVWRDPDFDPNARSFYYARVLENPSCRWSQYACNARGVRCDDPATIPEDLEVCCREDHRKVIQERAWTSPIWYSPASAS